MKTRAFRGWVAAAILGAAVLATPVVAIEPGHAFQHLQRAQSDAKAGNFTAAVRRLEWLLLTDTGNAARSKTYQGALYQLLSQKPLSFSFSGTVLSSSNVKRNSSENTFQTDIGDFTIGGSDDAGLGLRVGASGTYRHAYAVGRDVAATLSISTSYYDDISLRSTTPKVTVSHRWSEAGATYAMSVFASQTIFPEIETRSAPDSTSGGVSFRSTHTVGDGASMGIDLSWRDQTYSERDYLDGTNASFGLRYTGPVSDRGKITLRGGLSRADIEAGHFSYAGRQVGVSYAHTTKGGFAWNVGYNKAWRDYDDIFTALSYARADDIDTVSVGVSHRDIKIKGLTPRLTCSSKMQQSNVALYTYDSFDCFVSLRHAF